jgi:hypothetical protein
LWRGDKRQFGRCGFACAPAFGRVEARVARGCYRPN